MFVLFITSENNVCKLVASKLAQKDIHSKVMEDPFDSFDFIKNKTDKKIDLLALDYRCCIHENFSFFTLLKENKIFIPAFFYNHPLICEENCIEVWKDSLDEYFEELLPREELEQVKTVFVHFKEVLFSPEVNPYVSIINRPKILYDMSSAENTSFLNSREFTFDFSYRDLECLKNQFHLPPSRYKLLKYFFEHKNSPCKISEICNFMWNEYDSKKIQTLYAYIYDLKSVLKKWHKKSVELARFAKEEYIFLTGKYNNEVKQNFFADRQSDL